MAPIMDALPILQEKSMATVTEYSVSDVPQKQSLIANDYCSDS